jgi:hypothetical protein
MVSAQAKMMSALIGSIPTALPYSLVKAVIIAAAFNVLGI